MFARALGQVRYFRQERFLNRITLIGRVGADAQLKGSAETPVVQFSVATNRDYQVSGEVPKPEWHRVAVFKQGLRQLAERYVKTGSRVYVEGRLSYSTYRNTQNQEVNSASIIADNILFLSLKANEEIDDKFEDFDENQVGI